MTPATRNGHCDGLLGRECQTPDHWPACEQYLQAYLAGREYRQKYNIKITFEEMKR